MPTKALSSATILLLAILCAGSSSADCENPDVFVPAEATGVKYRSCSQVEYVVKQQFPASEFIEDLSEHMTERGWTALEQAPDGSGIKFQRWRSYTAEDDRQTKVDEWHGMFAHDDGSRVLVALRCFGRNDDDAPVAVLVSVVFATAEQWERRPR